MPQLPNKKRGLEGGNERKPKSKKRDKRARSSSRQGTTSEDGVGEEDEEDEPDVKIAKSFESFTASTAMKNQATTDWLQKRAAKEDLETAAAKLAFVKQRLDAAIEYGMKDEEESLRAQLKQILFAS